MKRLFLLGFMLTTVLLQAGLRDSCAGQTKDEKNLEREAARLEKFVQAGGEQAVLARFRKDFGASDGQVASLRQRGLGFGEIAVVLALVQKQPGGVTDASIEKVLALRLGPPPSGWGEVAKKLNLKLGAAVSQVKKITNESHRETKTGRREEKRQSPPAEPPGQPRGAHGHFSGEGRSMTRGEAAQ
ncbi:MAG: hypothetical protein M0042_14400 [Nitrospiraceae bacterium]|nr:hypothetical protein [Nitrospiraceae bacterium]